MFNILFHSKYIASPKKPHQNSCNSVRFVHTYFDFSSSLLVSPSCSKAKLCNSKADKNVEIHYCTEVKTMPENIISAGSGLACAFFIFFNITHLAEVWYRQMWPLGCHCLLQCCLSFTPSNMHRLGTIKTCKTKLCSWALCAWNV